MITERTLAEHSLALPVAIAGCRTDLPEDQRGAVPLSLGLLGLSFLVHKLSYG